MLKNEHLNIDLNFDHKDVFKVRVNVGIQIIVSIFFQVCCSIDGTVS
jgi:hypothetical protein